MGAIDPNLLERRFRVVETSDAGHAILDAFQDSFARYCVIGDRWAPGEYGLLLNKTRFLGDLVDLRGYRSAAARTLEQLLAERPGLLSTFIGGAVLKDFQFCGSRLHRVDLDPQIKTHIDGFLKGYLQTWPRRNELRARVVDVRKLDETRLHTATIAIAGRRVVGIIDRFDDLIADKSRAMVMPDHPRLPPRLSRRFGRKPPANLRRLSRTRVSVSLIKPSEERQCGSRSGFQIARSDADRTGPSNRASRTRRNRARHRER